VKLPFVLSYQCESDILIHTKLVLVYSTKIIITTGQYKQHYQIWDYSLAKVLDILKTFYKVCDRVGVSDFHFHDLRHTYASQLVMANVNLTTVSRLMGHKTLAMTLRYSHLAPDFLDSAASLLDSRLNPVASEITTTDQTA
jgi:integrase